jgi:hypothetical protein
VSAISEAKAVSSCHVNLTALAEKNSKELLIEGHAGVHTLSDLQVSLL